ncbi:unnamed protein product [Bemisia tabaci]|uniref:Chromatin accessibility complex protein 1 n=1 Tax=Bemisia tabaci TaxID=7038 RepID=A0A9P0A6A9_BEMTA|nr:PREDICTED: chromatin accessibility complex protein 1 [Bemisia tabaci]CAH0385165.1 unnamed protein product [Bemisia tabaci]
MAPNSATKVKELLLPVSRVKTIMKSSPDVENVGQDALHLVTKSTELFVQYLTRMSYKKSPDGNKLEYKQLAEFVQNKNSMRFLREILPKKITVKQYKQMLRSQGELHTSDSSSDSGSSDDSESEDSEESDDSEKSEGTEGDEQEKSGKDKS